jgi:hypothetical protein
MGEQDIDEKLQRHNLVTEMPEIPSRVGQRGKHR